MPGIATQQLDAIHSMLAAGHHSLRVERHSLVLLGLAGGCLFLLSDLILTPEQFPDTSHRAIAWLLLLAFVLGAVGIADWHLIRRAKRAREEAWSFIHRQMLKVLWLLMGMGVLLTFAMFFFGGGYMLCSAWLVLLGLGLYVHGLFSEELLEWVGALVIVIGILSLAFRLPYETMKWIAAAVFGIGLPLLAAMLDRGRARPFRHRLAQTVAWSVAVLALPLIAERHAAAADLPDGPVISLDAFLQQRDAPGARIVSLPAGSAIPVAVEVSGNLFGDAPGAVLPLTLAEPVEVLMLDGKPTGDIRPPGGRWRPARGALMIQIPRLRAELDREAGPVVRASLVVDFRARPGE